MKQQLEIPGLAKARPRAVSSVSYFRRGLDIWRVTKTTIGQHSEGRVQRIATLKSEDEARLELGRFERGLCG